MESKNINIQCKTCGKDFTVHIAREHSAKYCSRKCKDASVKGQKAWNLGMNKAEQTVYREKRRLEKAIRSIPKKKCVYCGKPVRGKFCNRQCQMAHQNTLLKGISFEERYGKVKAVDIRSRMSASITDTAKRTGFTKVGAKASSLTRRGKSWTEAYGTKSYEAMSSKIKESLHTFFYTTEAGLKQRKEASRRGLEYTISGKEFSNSKKGYYKTAYYGSSLELEFLKRVIEVHGSLHSVRRNKTKVPVIGSLFKMTIPDYALVDKEDNAIALIEVKSEHFFNRPVVANKLLSLYRYGQLTNVPVGMFTYAVNDTLLSMHANPEPSQAGSLVEECISALNDFHSWKVQRLTVEGGEPNKTVKDNEFTGTVIPNDPALGTQEHDIVRYPMKVGEEVTA